jgi:hypothetical protein
MPRRTKKEKAEGIDKDKQALRAKKIAKKEKKKAILSKKSRKK